MPADRPILLLTRPKDASLRFAEQAKAQFGETFDIIQAPLQQIEWVDSMVESDHKALIFTSQNGVLGWIRANNQQTRPAYCVGVKTAELAKSYGFDAIEAGADANALVDRILLDRPQSRLLHVRGANTVGDVAKRLNQAGIDTDETTIYRQIRQDLTDVAIAALLSDRMVIAPLFSPKSAEIFQAVLPNGAQPWVAVISLNAAERLDLMLQRRMMVATQPNAVGMLDAISSILARSPSP